MVYWFITLLCDLASGKAAGFGALKDGYMFECSTGFSRMWDVYLVSLVVKVIIGEDE